MSDTASIKAGVAANPLPLLTALYGDSVQATGNNEWRAGSGQGKKFDTKRGELLACDFTGDGESGDCFSVVMNRRGYTFPEALAFILSLYSVEGDSGPHAAIRKASGPREDKEAKLNRRFPEWPAANKRHVEFWHEARARLMSDEGLQDHVGSLRGWHPIHVKVLATTGLIGATDFNLWPGQIRPQPCAVFPVYHPRIHRDHGDTWEAALVQVHVRFLVSGAATKDGRRLTWLYAPSKSEHGMEEGGNAPLVLARGHRDPGVKCHTVVVTAGEWDALSFILAAGWLNDSGTLPIPDGLAVVGIRGEGRGGTDSFLRHCLHWRSRSVIMLADADDTGATWFKSEDERPCFAEQLQRRGATIIPRVPKNAKDINDLYRAGEFGLPDVEGLLEAAGLNTKGEPK